MNIKRSECCAKIQLVLFALLYFVAVLLTGCSERDPRIGDNGEMAFIMCQRPVLAQLRAPSSARFPTSYSTRHLGEGTYKVEAQVDSQNGFGAMLRSAWSCEIQELPGDRWRILNLEF